MDWRVGSEGGDPWVGKSDNHASWGLWSVTGGTCDVVCSVWVWVELNGIVGIYGGEISSQSELSDLQKDKVE